jgi:hypothetical protein
MHVDATPPNTPLQLTSAVAAQGVVPPPCSLTSLAAEWHVRLILKRREVRHLHTFVRGCR